MIESFKLENFRCYRLAELKGLPRINVIVGRNASGKTALLEALFFACASGPEVALRLRTWRGLGDVARIGGLEGATAEALWGDLFYNFDRRRMVSITLRGSKDSNRSVRIEFQPRQTATTIQSKDAPELKTALPIRFSWRTSKGENLVVTPEMTPDGLRMGTVGSAAPGVFFHAAAMHAPQETAARFSKLSRRNEEASVIEALQSEFPFVQGLSVELNAGLPMVYASVKNVSEKLPLGLVSSGVNKLLALLVAIADSRRGTVFVDEIDNGFYYDRLPPMWTLLREFCERHDCQIFCSTHSRECIESMGPALKEHEDAFALIRVESGDEGQVLRSFHGEDLIAAVQQHAELR